jgi:glyoxylase-like metal-dependent hydrolase (beta-lactamase superfamily II)
MKNKLYLALALSFIVSILVAPAHASLNDQTKLLSESLKQKKWNHGSVDCKYNTDPAIEVHQYDQSSYVLRQNKCVTYEAPFIYVLFGEKKVLVLDTGATESPVDFPLYETVKSLLEKQSEQSQNADMEILVIHSHGHRDHYTGDFQFEGKQNVTVVAPNRNGIDQYFGFNNWPEDVGYVELGGRKITIIPTPGHQEEAISIYDPQTKWLLTGDTFYPGAIYVKDWSEYKNSIARLASFTNSNEVSLVLGAHIEMTNKASEYYSIGTIYQPDEASLALMPKDLSVLHSALEKSVETKTIVLEKLVVEPMGLLQITISNIARWLTQ